MSKYRTHYDNLKVSRNAPDAVIKAAYKALLQKYHPDKYEGDPCYALKVTKVIRMAFSVLIDPVKRAEHNEWIDRQEKKSQDENKKASFTVSDSESTFERAHYQKRNKPFSQGNNEKERFKPLYLWRRYFARNVDFILAGFLLVLMFYVISASNQELAQQIYLFFFGSQNESQSAIKVGFFATLLWVPIEYIFLLFFGTTPGKFLFNLKLSSNGHAPMYLKRCFYVWLLGMGFGVPFFQFIANYFSYKNIKKNRVAYWDSVTNCKVESGSLNFFKFGSAAIVIFLCIYFLVVVSPYQQKAGKPQKNVILNSEQVEKEKGSFVKRKNIASRQLSPISAYERGQRYKDGDGVPVSDKEAFKWFLVAAEGGHERAKVLVGISKYFGIGTSVDLKGAYQWLIDFAEKGDVVSQSLVGSLLLYGIEGVPQNVRKAIQFLSNAAEHEDSSAMYQLGLYWGGRARVEDDLIEAHMWFNLAVTYGEPSAAKERDATAYLMNNHQLDRAQELALDWVDRH